MIFISILILSALSLAGTAAYFSVVGLATIFAASFWPVVIMGSVLEAGKLVTASFLYRFWHKIRMPMKIYLCSAVLVLMLITSAGIFGILSGSYQHDSLPLKQMEAKVQMLTQERDTLADRKKQIDGIIAAISPNYITKRIEQQKKFEAEENNINKRIPELNKEIQELTEKKLNQEAHTGPIVYLAKLLGRPIDDATAYMLYLIMFVFDPLAVTLTIGANMAVIEHKKTKTGDKKPEENIVRKTAKVEPKKETNKEPPPSATAEEKRAWKHRNTF